LHSELTKTIRKCRLSVKDKKTLRDALQLGVYLVGERVFVVIDIDTAYEVTNGKLTTLTREDYQKYIKHKHFISTPQEFASLPEEILKTLIEIFNEVTKEQSTPNLSQGG